MLKVSHFDLSISLHTITLFSCEAGRDMPCDTNEDQNADVVSTSIKMHHSSWHDVYHSLESPKLDL